VILDIFITLIATAFGSNYNIRHQNYAHYNPQSICFRNSLSYMSISFLIKQSKANFEYAFEIKFPKHNSGVNNATILTFKPYRKTFETKRFYL